MTAPKTVSAGAAADLKVIRGQHTEFMWQGLAGVPVTVTDGAGKIVAQTRTDDSGQIVLTKLKPGSYQLNLTGAGLVAAADRLAPAPEKSMSAGGSSAGNAPMITFTATVSPATSGPLPADAANAKPYSRAIAGQGMRIPFTVPQRRAAGTDVDYGQWTGKLSIKF